MYKREIVEATLYNEIGGMMFKFEDMEKVNKLYNATLLAKSVVGFYMNQLYDDIMELTHGQHVEFVTTVLTEIDVEEYRLMIMMLYNKIPIEDEINKFVLNHVAEYL